MAAEPAAASRSRMNIGEVLDRLRPDFPGVTIPKIRFLEDKGLIKPERTPAGYRKFTGEDVERLRYVLRMQRDHYLPLKVIGEHLDAIDRGLEPPPIEAVVPTVPKVALAADGLPERRLLPSHRQGAALAQGAAQDRRDLRGAPRPARAVRADRAAHRHRPLRHRRPRDRDDGARAGRLRPRAAPPARLRTAADREVGLVEQVVAPLRAGRDAAAAARADDAVSEIAALSVRLHATLVKAGLTSS